MDTNLPKSASRQQLNGQMMLKYTNVVKGWQYRWFTVDAQTGTLKYFLPANNWPSSSQSSQNLASESPHSVSSASRSVFDNDGSSTSSVFNIEPINSSTSNHISGSPRWQEHLAGATIHPSEEDSRSFTIVCASGDTLKIRATNAQARQVWVDGLRSIAETHSTQISAIKHNFHRKRFSKKHFPSIGSHTDIMPSRENADAYTNARQQIHNTELCNAALVKSIDNVVSPLSPTDPDVLMLKAVSAASTHCLLQCLALVQRHHEISGDVRVRSHSEAAF